MVALKDPSVQLGTLELSKTDIIQLNKIYDCTSKRWF